MSHDVSHTTSLPIPTSPTPVNVFTEPPAKIAATEISDNPNLTQATKAAQSIGGVAVPVFGAARPDGATDFNDMARSHGLDAAREVDNGAVNKACDEATFRRLADLSPVEYDRARITEAEQLKIRVSALDHEVEARRPRNAAGNNATGSGRSLVLPDAVPWLEPVNGAVVLLDMAAVIQRHISLPRHAEIALVLWCAWAWMMDRFDIAPRLAVLSPEKRCGKSTLLEVLFCLVPRPLLTSNISPAAIFRTIEAAQPTLMIDEADTFTKDNEELRGILNSGHTRGGATIVRVVGDDFEPRIFSTWCPMVLAAIGSLPGTVEDRSIIVPMQRKAPGTTLRSFPRGGKRAAALRDELQILARKVKRWADDHGPALADADPPIPAGLHDRAADNWRPLLAIADRIGGEWPDKARAASTVLSGGASSDSESLKVRLLADIRTILDATAGDRIGSQTLCDALAAMEERPWSEWRMGKPISPAQLARLMRPFGVVSGTIRLTDGTTAKGYYRDSFDEAFSRYLPEFTHSNRQTVTSLVNSGDEPLLQSVTPSPRDVSENATNPAPVTGCDGVTDQNPVFPEE